MRTTRLAWTLLALLGLAAAVDGALLARAAHWNRRIAAGSVPADAESPVLLGDDLPAVGVLAVSHHGSGDPLLGRLLARLQPRLAVISVGAHNTYGHPSPATLAALAQAGVPVRRTDLEGDIGLACDADG